MVDLIYLNLIGIKYTHYESDKVIAELPITEKLTQPFGILHGGVSVVLAESVASLASLLNVDFHTHSCVGLEINANHIAAGNVGETLVATGTPYYRGKRTQVWGIEIRSKETNKLICVSRCTTAVIPASKRVTNVTLPLMHENDRAPQLPHESMSARL